MTILDSILLTVIIKLIFEKLVALFPQLILFLNVSSVVSVDRVCPLLDLRVEPAIFKGLVWFLALWVDLGSQVVDVLKDLLSCVVINDDYGVD
jgi:hypothetical protein